MVLREIQTAGARMQIHLPECAQAHFLLCNLEQTSGVATHPPAENTHTHTVTEAENANVIRCKTPPNY